MVSKKEHESEGLVLAIDVGSSSVRANLFDLTARKVVGFESQIQYESVTTGDGGVEIDAESLLKVVFGAIGGTLEKAGEAAARLLGVGMCSFVPNVVGVDGEGRVVTPVYSWADTRPAEQAARLRERLDEREVRERTGCPIHPSYLPAKLLWLREHDPEAFEQVGTWMSVGDLVYARLFGEAQQSISVASWSGLLNRHTLDWDGEMLGVVGVGRGSLPGLADVAAGLIGLMGEFGERWPSLKDVPWFPCVGDGVTSNLGSGCYGPGHIAAQIGTSGAMRALVPGGVTRIPEGLWCYRLDREMALLGGALSEGGNLLDWLYGLLGVEDKRGLEKEAERLEADSHGLTVLPFVAGERSPGWRGDARAVVYGLSLDSKPSGVVRACEEAIAYRFGMIYELIRDVMPAPERIVASGGALLGVAGWVQMLADVLGVEVTASAEKEASSKGTAMLVLRALGVLDGFDEVEPALGERFAPDMGRHEVYRRGMERQSRIYRGLYG